MVRASGIDAYGRKILLYCTGWPMSLMKTSRWLSSDSIGSWWAATIAAYCPGRMAEHLKSKSMGGFHQGAPCRLCPYLTFRWFWTSVAEGPEGICIRRITGSSVRWLVALSSPVRRLSNPVQYKVYPTIPHKVVMKASIHPAAGTTSFLCSFSGCAIVYAEWLIS